jgi:hypothetical protein
MDDFVAIIFAELRDGGLNDPRRLDDRATSFPDYVRAEVRRGILRVQMLVTPSPELRHLLVGLPVMSASRYHKVGKELEAIAFTPAQLEVARQLQEIWQEPPERSDSVKYRCAMEACDLMLWFSVTPPTGTAEGPFQKIATHIYSAVIGHEPTDMKRSCDRVLKKRRRYASAASNRP